MPRRARSADDPTSAAPNRKHGVPPPDSPDPGAPDAAASPPDRNHGHRRAISATCRERARPRLSTASRSPLPWSCRTQNRGHREIAGEIGRTEIAAIVRTCVRGIFATVERPVAGGDSDAGRAYDHRAWSAGTGHRIRGRTSTELRAPPTLRRRANPGLQRVWTWWCSPCWHSMTNSIQPPIRTTNRNPSRPDSASAPTTTSGHPNVEAIQPLTCGGNGATLFRRWHAPRLCSAPALDFGT